eukprot:snap_masked-scaffold_8-processed-gene-7.39-mRNA-1 protein AED:0.33 eAED:0.33 QI:0/0/0/1/1/1/2/0/469
MNLSARISFQRATKLLLNQPKKFNLSYKPCSKKVNYSKSLRIKGLQQPLFARRFLEQARYISSENTPSSNKPEKKSSPPHSLDSLSYNAVVRALIGNTVVTTLKFFVWVNTNSSSMFSESLHSLADTTNQLLLLAGIHQSSKSPDKKHQYGYGKAAFFWALVSAMGTFVSGSLLSLYHSGSNMYSALTVHGFDSNFVDLDIWGVLGTSFLVDAVVLSQTIKALLKGSELEVLNRNETRWNKLKNNLKFLGNIRDPFLAAVIFEDFVACTGVLVASGGIFLSHYFENPLFDYSASMTIGIMLGYTALKLINLNKEYLLGYSVPPKVTQSIHEILTSRPAIDKISVVQTQWIGPGRFSYKAEVDFDGTYFAAKLSPMYLDKIFNSETNEEAQMLLSFYAEDVLRAVELEIRECDLAVREVFPNCDYIELEPDSKFVNVNALPNVDGEDFEDAVSREKISFYRKYNIFKQNK